MHRLVQCVLLVVLTDCSNTILSTDARPATDAGFDVQERCTAPLHLLEPRRLLADEGLAGAARFVGNVIRRPDARARVLAMRRAMGGNAAHLQACVVVATRRGDS